jgi:hypothetical protein
LLSKYPCLIFRGYAAGGLQESPLQATSEPNLNSIKASAMPKIAKQEVDSPQQQQRRRYSAPVLKKIQSGFAWDEVGSHIMTDLWTLRGFYVGRR